jgi:hypothetical protein
MGPFACGVDLGRPGEVGGGIGPGGGVDANRGGSHGGCDDEVQGPCEEKDSMYCII